MTRNQARTQARQESDTGMRLMRASDKLWAAGQRAEARAMVAQAKQFFATCDEYCAIAAGTKQAISAPIRTTDSRVAPDDF